MSWLQALEPTQLTDPWLRAGLVILGSVVLAWVVNFIVSRLFKRWAQHTHTDIDDQLVALLHRPMFWSVLTVGTWLAVLQLSLPNPYHKLVSRGLATLVIILWGSFFIRLSALVLEVASRIQDRVTWIQTRTLPLFHNMARIFVFGAAGYLLCVAWDVNLTAWMASAGILGLAVGFAAKDTLANLFGGFFILADAPYKMGDFVVLDSGERGQVTHIGLRSTRLLTRDDVEVTIPNAVIANGKIVNESGGPWIKYRLRAKVGVAYGSDVDQVRAVLMEIAEGNELVETQPEPRVRFRAFGDSSLDFELLVWVAQPILRGRVLDAINTEIYKRFQAAGIAIPFPQRDLHLVSGSLVADSPTAAPAD